MSAFFFCTKLTKVCRFSAFLKKKRYLCRRKSEFWINFKIQIK